MPALQAVPDVGAVLGPYTYLASEVVFGAVALVLLSRADALRRAARTILALYPIAFVWDWYTLRIGVFEIDLRTGVELLGIPIEEHLFIVVVPALVIGFHETLHGERVFRRRPFGRRMGEDTCYLDVCPACDAELAPDDEECPDCGRDV